MSDSREEKGPDLLQLLDELSRLEEEQRTLDLRDPRAVSECQRKIDALRRRIKLLDRPRGGYWEGSASPRVR
jgi:hypothetical protein